MMNEWMKGGEDINKMSSMMADWEKSWAQNMNDLGENTMYEP
jgi:hypothetical protein